VKYSPEYLYGKRMYERYVDLYLKGDFDLASRSFYKSMKSFQNRDDMCNISRLFISRYFVDEDYDNYKYLDKAEKYASLKECRSERNLIRLLKGQECNEDYLSKLSRAYAEFRESGESAELLSELDTKQTHDSAKSRFYRLLALNKIDSDIAKAEKFVEKAHEIDSFHAWKLNIYRDLRLKFKICKEKNNVSCDNLKIRMEMISNRLGKN